MVPKVNVHETDVAGKTGVVLVVPPELLWVFKQVLDRGMAFEFGQPQAMYDLADRLKSIN